MPNNLKQVTEDEYQEFLTNYKGKLTLHDWDEVVLYFDFNRHTNHPILSQEMMCDCLVAMRITSPYFYCEEYYIIDEN